MFLFVEPAHFWYEGVNKMVIRISLSSTPFSEVDDLTNIYKNL